MNAIRVVGRTEARLRRWKNRSGGRQWKSEIREEKKGTALDRGDGDPGRGP